MPRLKLLAYCDDCEHAWIPDKSRGKLQCSECGNRNVLRAAPDEILDDVRKKAQEKAERNRGGVMPSTAVKCRWCGAYFAGTESLKHHIEKDHPREWARTRDKLEKERGDKPSGPGKSRGAEQLTCKRIGVEPTKLERIIAGWNEWPERMEIDESGRPRVSEEQNVEWVHLVGKVEWRTAHKIFHEVLMRNVECTLPIGYEPME